MRRSLRTFLFLLVLLSVGLLGWRIARGTDPATGDVVLDDFRTFRLYGQTLTVAAPARVAIDAVGSDGATDSLEAMAWLLDARTRTPVWKMTPASARRVEGTLVRTRDTLDLPAGDYELYFSTLGHTRIDRDLVARVFSRTAHWRNDAKRWYVALTALQGSVERGDTIDPSDVVEGTLAQGEPPPSSDTTVLWRASSTYSETSESFLVQAPSVLDVTVVGTGEATAELLDGDDGPVWTLSPGGAAGPRGYRTQRVRVPVAPGTYRLRFDGKGVGPSEWDRHPPYDPRAWGLTARAAEGRFRRFDPFADLTPAVRIRADRGSGRWTVPFEVLRETKVIVHAMGEIGDESASYDGGGLYNASGETVWEIERDGSEEAGGVSKNRVAMRTLTLAPGAYEARFFTDDTHHIGAWNSDTSAPDRPERYGLTVFALTPEDIAVKAPIEAAAEGPPSPPSAPEPPKEPGAASASGETLAAIENVRNDDDDEASFSLDRPSVLRVEAAAEPDDDVYILSDTGETVWTIDGIDAKDGWRIVRTEITLPAGRYTLRAKADGSKAAVTFSKETGLPRRDYGIRVIRVR